MIIKSVGLENIRSYREASIQLARGRTLFEGDIGSGKSTLLMAIEFALFGLGSEKGASLLRSGEQNGSVTLVFEVDGEEYSVRRNLTRKAGKIHQTDGEFVGPEGTEALSPKEMKERVLKILGFAEPLDPKAQSVIYRYAVYTPQEEMKEILSMDPDLRLQTLRKAFGIEDYRTAKDNALELSREIQNRARILEASAGDLATLTERVREREVKLEAKKAEAMNAAAEAEREERTRASLENEMETLRENEKELSAARQKLTLLEGFFESKSRELSALSKEIDSVDRKAARVRSQVEAEEHLEDPSPMTEEEIAEEVSRIESHILELTGLQARTDAKIEDYRSVRETGSCPTCDRKADPDEFVEKERAQVKEKDRRARILEDHGVALANAKRSLDSKRKYDSSMDALNEHRRTLDDAEDELREKRARESQLRYDYEDTEKKLFRARKDVELLSGVSENIMRIRSEIDSAEGKLRGLRSTVDKAGRDVENLKQGIQEDEAEIRKKEEAKRKASLLRDHAIWIEDYFVQALDAIERQVLTSINQDFNSHFQEWFSTLVEDQSKEARIDEDFDPVVEQDGYEQEVRYMSGGERTSLALAYRLALNGIVRRVSTGMKSNLLILDEPTDGFSNEQLGKMREILDEIESPQVIIVSHDKELESFADQIYRVVKEGGESKVLVAA